MSTALETIRTNLLSVQDRIAAACQASGREASSVKLIAVVKYAELAWVRDLLEIGVRDLGESRPQQLLQRAEQFDDSVSWHQIGHLQRNKIRKVLPLTSLIHTIDSVKLLQAVDRVAAELSLTVPVLLQINVSGEPSKGGLSPAELPVVWETATVCTHVELQGLMTMAPGTRDLEEARETFAALRRLRDDAEQQLRGRLSLPELSMGMSGDFEIAIKEGATMVRIGSGLFEGLNPAGA